MYNGIVVQCCSHTCCVASPSLSQNCLNKLKTIFFYSRRSSWDASLARPVRHAIYALFPASPSLPEIASCPACVQPHLFPFHACLPAFSVFFAMPTLCLAHFVHLSLQCPPACLPALLTGCQTRCRVCLFARHVMASETLTSKQDRPGQGSHAEVGRQAQFRIGRAGRRKSLGHSGK